MLHFFVLTSRFVLGLAFCCLEVTVLELILTQSP